MMEPRWVLVNPKVKRDEGHLFFKNLYGPEVAVADWSISQMHDPASTDDGLLLIDFSQPAVVSETGVYFKVTSQGQTGYNTSETLDYGLQVLPALIPFGLKVSVEPALAARIVKLNEISRMCGGVEVAA